MPIGIDGLAIVVHKSNPVANLHLRNCVICFLEANGQLARTRGGEDILLVSREDGSGARHLFESLLRH